MVSFDSYLEKELVKKHWAASSTHFKVPHLNKFLINAEKLTQCHHDKRNQNSWVLVESKQITTGLYIVLS